MYKIIDNLAELKVLYLAKSLQISEIWLGMILSMAFLLKRLDILCFVIFRFMKTYDELREICERTSRISGRVVDDYLINYAAGHHGLEKKMEQQFARYSHVGRQLGKKAVNMLKSQYLAHKLFKVGGLIGKFLKHPALDSFRGEERDYLAQQHKLAWRFCFSVIVDTPAKDFYTMEDVFTGKRYLLFSPGVSDILSSGSPVLWFNLMGFNGFCWQSYGPVVYYNSFEAGDIWFFATELNPDIEEAEEVLADVDQDSLPYMMLISGATLPMTFYKGEQVLYLLAEHDLATLDTGGLKKDFRTEYDSGVYRISHKQWGENPHYAQVYFDENKHLLLFSAMTDRGFDLLVEAFNAYGHDFPVEPYLRVNMTMVTTANEILKRKVLLNEYHDLFQEEPDPASEKVIEEINAFIALVLPDINAGRTPDMEEAIRKSGIDPENARNVMKSVMGKLDSLPGKHAEASALLPAQPREGIRLLSSDDELLFGLHLYTMAGAIQRMAPWEYLFEDEVFGVQVPGTDRLYFVSVMGSSGEFQALSFYKDYQGLVDFMEFRADVERVSRLGLTEDGMLHASTMIGGPFTIPHLMISYADREELGKDNLAAIRKSGVPFRGKGQWPQIEEIVPGYVPVYPSKESLRELFLVMQQTLIVLERAGEDDNYLLREDDQEPTFLVRIPTGKGPRFKWKDHYLLADPEWDETKYAVNIIPESSIALSGLPEASQELQLDLFMLPASVREKGGRAYFPFVLMMIEKLNGMVISTSILSPQPDLRSMYESIPQKVLEELLKSGHRPSKIEVRSDLLHELLEEILEKAGCRVVWVTRMPLMDEAIGSLISHMS